MRVNYYLTKCACVAALAMAASCSTMKVGDTVGASPELMNVQSLLDSGRYAEAIVAASDLARKDQFMPGLADMQSEIMRRIAEDRAKAYSTRGKNSESLMMNDNLLHSVIPETYRIRNTVKGESGSLASAPSRMQEALGKNVTIHLDDASLSAIAAQIAQSDGINIVADADLGDASLTIHAEDTPLSEILEYVGRNLGVEFSVGENLIWATKLQGAGGTLPLETRVYRLRKGLSGDEMLRPSGGDGAASSGGASEPTVIEVLTRFVDQPEGSDIYYSPKAHALIVKNTKANLNKSEILIDALDVTPPQVLIEARFISASVGDLSELGVDWILDSEYATSHKTVSASGRTSRETKTRINPGSSPILGGSAFANSAIGGNFTFQGVLTDPQFRAIVHILETSNKARTLSVPRVTTVNNRPAKIRVGEDFRYYEQYDLEEVRDGTDSNGNATYVSRNVPSGSPTLEELGIELSATPSVGADMSSINLALIPEISEFVRWEYFETNLSDADLNSNDDERKGIQIGVLKLPVFRRNRIETEVIVRSGETVVMGGLISGSKTKKVEGVPILSRIPLIGYLFKHDVEDEIRQNLIIFVTATIISETGEELVPLAEALAAAENAAEETVADAEAGGEQPGANAGNAGVAEAANAPAEVAGPADAAPAADAQAQGGGAADGAAAQ